MHLSTKYSRLSFPPHHASPLQFAFHIYDFPKIRIQQRELMSTVIALASSLLWYCREWHMVNRIQVEISNLIRVGAPVPALGSTSTPTTAQLPCHIVLLSYNFLSQPTGPQSCNPLAQVGISRWAIKHISSLWPTETQLISWSSVTAVFQGETM